MTVAVVTVQRGPEGDFVVIDAVFGGLIPFEVGSCSAKLTELEERQSSCVILRGLTTVPIAKSE